MQSCSRAAVLSPHKTTNEQSQQWRNAQCQRTASALKLHIALEGNSHTCRMQWRKNKYQNRILIKSDKNIVAFKALRFGSNRFDCGCWQQMCMNSMN